MPRLQHLALVACLVAPLPSLAAPEPCGLLTPDEVTAAAGGKFGAGQAISKTSCAWTSPKPHLIVTASFEPAKDWGRLKTAQLPGVVIAPASGLGDDAFYATLLPYTMVYVKKGETVILVKVYGVKEQEKQRDIVTALARSALARL